MLLRYQPTLRTKRLLLRPFVADDALVLQGLAGAREVADTSLWIQHPCTITAARSWIAGLHHFFETRTAVHFAIHLPSDLIGSVALRDIDREHARAELEFWIGRPWWGSGYATEAANEAIRFGFEQLSLNRIRALRLARDPVSDRVLGKLGMKQEGLLRQRVKKWGEFEDASIYALLRDDWSSSP
jgi:ribosomal-protein-alanine N-acetyltransferase